MDGGIEMSSTATSAAAESPLAWPPLPRVVAGRLPHQRRTRRSSCRGPDHTQPDTGGWPWRPRASAGSSIPSAPCETDEHGEPYAQPGEYGGHDDDLVGDRNLEHGLLT